MATHIIRKFDRFIDLVSILVIVCGGMLLHTLTALTIKSYYGDVWGYVSFFLPVFSEIFLAIIQVADNLYNYPLLLGIFIAVISVSGLGLIMKNSFKARLEESVNG
jgi:hypothetical protein